MRVIFEDRNGNIYFNHSIYNGYVGDFIKCFCDGIRCSERFIITLVPDDEEV